MTEPTIAEPTIADIYEAVVALRAEVSIMGNWLRNRGRTVDDADMGYTVLPMDDTPLPWEDDDDPDEVLFA